MKKILENGKYIIYLAIISSFLSSIFLFIVTTIKIFNDFISIAKSLDLTRLLTTVISSLDSYILAIIVYIFAISLYELFIGQLEVPDWLVVTNLDDLKKKLSSVIALILAVLFLKHVVEWEDGKETMYFAISITLIMAILIVYMNYKERHLKK